MIGVGSLRQVRGPLAAAPIRARLGNGIRTTTDRHNDRDVVWQESKRAWAALLDVAGVALRYRVLVDEMFVQPDWGFRRSLRQAKAEGVAFAVAVGVETAAAREAHRARKGAAEL